MKKLTSRVILIIGAIVACQSAFGQVPGGQPVPNDLYMGFQNSASGGTADYIINLGPASGITNGSTVVNLSSDFSLADYQSSKLDAGNASTIVGGVVGGQNNDEVSTADIFVTVNRTGGAQVAPSSPGSTENATENLGEDCLAFNDMAQLDAPTNGTGVLDTNKTWETYVDLPTYDGTASFYGQSGVNPDSTIGNTVYEDLWYTGSSFASKPFTYLGYFTINVTGSPSLTFTPKGAPAPLLQPTILSVTNAAANTVTVVWSTVETRSYALQYSTSLTTPSWITIGTSTPASGLTMTNSDATATGTQRFYRIKAQ